jgi:hypothetical protein
MAKRRTQKANPTRAARPVPTLALLRAQVDALTHHPDPEVHGEAIGLLDEVCRAEEQPSLNSFARLDGQVFHARMHAPRGSRGLFLAAHSTARRLYTRKLWLAGPVPATPDA